MRLKVKYRDIVKPQMKAIAESVRLQAEAETGNKYKLGSLVAYSDEFLIELKEIKNNEKANPEADAEKVS